MRILWVVQRYGREVLGGAEAEAREVAIRLAHRGHDIEILTSCASDYVTWANHFPPGPSHEDGVVVHRLPARQERSPAFFELDGRMRRAELLSRSDQEAWLLAQGPLLVDLPAWLRSESVRFDVAVFTTYLYYPTVVGLPIAASLLPTVLVPTAHDEPALHQALFDTVFHHADRLYYNSLEEAALIERRIGCKRPGDVIGTGVELDLRGDENDFPAGVGPGPYLVYVGRIDEHKGALVLHRWFTRYKARHPGPLKLVLVGRPAVELEPHHDVVLTGFVDEGLRNALLEGALALIQLSPNESFSIVLAEAWACGTPAIVTNRSPVLVGQAERSGGAIPVDGFAEFEAAVELLSDDQALRKALASAGRRYVEANYAWGVVLDRVQHCLLAAQASHGRASAPSS